MTTLALITPPGSQPCPPKHPLRVIGIDLGTTNSTIAEIFWQPGDTNAPRVRCLDVEQPSRQGAYTGSLVPSVVALQGGEVIVGEGAKDLRTRMKEYGLELYQNIFWECKNHIGVRRTYQKAPPGFQSAKEIAGQVLRFLAAAAQADDPTPVTQTVVTAPASFQTAQRNDTIEAAHLAGLDLDAGALLDEPVAAFLDYLVSHGRAVFGDIQSPRTLAVFDFGGGTCDVAVFQLQPPTQGELFQVAPLTVSRYHRLGGGDIDTAIVFQVLLPQLIAQNGLDAHTLDFEAKDKFIKPALLGLAESLKIGLCREIARLKRFGHYTPEARSNLVKKNPGVYQCALPGGQALWLKSPTLSAEQFDQVLEPFLDIDLLYARETDYGLTCSLFAPLGDALDRACLKPAELDLCLLVGGSTLIPQVPEALATYLSKARLLQFDDSEQTQTAIARGAAWQSLSLALYGRGIIQPVASDSLSIQTLTGPIELIPAGTLLPYPADNGWVENRRLVVPETNLNGPLKLRLGLFDSHGGLLGAAIWEIKTLVNKGDGMLLRYRLDPNQVLHLELSLNNRPEETCTFKLENPLTNVVNPNAKRDRILELEEQMRTKAIPKERQRDTVKEIALLYADLGQREHALDLLRNLLKPKPDGGILNHMGIIYGQLGDFTRQDKCYRQAAEVWNYSAPLFNLALSQKNQGRTEAAMQTIGEAIARAPEPPYFVLKALLHENQNQRQQRDADLQRAFATYNPLPTLNDWELGWFLTGAQLAQDEARQAAAKAEQQNRRHSKDASSPDQDGTLVPDTKEELVRR